jgi:hypothetical protein
MINSVDADYVAGEEYELDDELADRFIIFGYAEGELSRDYSIEERQELLGGNQEVGV